MRLLLARHGETDWNVQGRIQGRTDTELNARGRLQAEELGRRLLASGTRVDALYASPMRRALETAQIAGLALGLEPVAVPGLEEVCFGLWEGHTVEEVELGWPGQWKIYKDDRFRRSPPEGESFGTLLNRVLPALERIERSGEGTALVVSHGGVLRAVLCHRDGGPFDDSMIYRYPVPNAAWVAL